MKSQDKRYLRLEKALGRAYREREEKGGAVPGKGWEIAVMGRIRGLSLENGRPDWRGLFELFVWRLAPVCCALIVLLSVVLFRLDLSSELALAGGLVEEPLGEVFLLALGE
jgi:hypothetical protein